MFNKNLLICSAVVITGALFFRAIAKTMWKIPAIKTEVKSEVQSSNQEQPMSNFNADRNTRLRQTLINLSEEQALARMVEEDCDAVVVCRDNEPQMVPMNFDETRARLTIQSGRVVGVTFG